MGHLLTHLDESPKVFLFGRTLAQFALSAPSTARPLVVVRALRDLPPEGFIAPGSVTVLPIAGAFGADPLSLVRLAVQTIRGTTVVLAFDAHARGLLRTIPAMIRAGVTELLHLGFDDFWATVECTRQSTAVPLALRETVESLLTGCTAQFSDACRWTVRHVADGVTVNGLASHLGVNRVTLQRRFRSELGVTPVAWLRFVRLAALLHCRSQGMTLDDIAIHLHFSAGTHVSRYERHFSVGGAGGRSLGRLVGLAELATGSVSATNRNAANWSPALRAGLDR